MKDLPMSGACCAGSKMTKKADRSGLSPVEWLLGLAALALWFLVYRNLQGAASWLTSRIPGVEPGTRLFSSVEFFLYDTPKVLLLLTLVVFGVGIVRSFFTPERTRKLLAGRRESVGNVLAACLGIVTPFCSCSAVPLFIGFVTAGVPLGVTFSFLISAPMVNEIAVVLLYGLLGWKVAALYMGTGLAVAVVAGWVIGRLGLENHVEDWVRTIRAGEGPAEEEKTFRQRVAYGLMAVRDILGRVWIYVVAGIAVGAGIHGYVPEGFMAGIMGKAAWWSVPAAVAVGIPMYSNAAGIVPVVEALLGKGAALGTVLAFMMSVIALSLPEVVILRKVLKPRLIAAFLGVVGGGVLLVGWLFNLVL
ncbi:MAG: permease [Desulfovibrio aminophilus]|uniref:permease n=2 Tax=Desulfovibrio TaxID=872 RepID=UPI0039EA8E9D